MRDFESPKSKEECVERILKLEEEIVEIEVQLVDRNRLNESGERMSPSDYKAWRSKAGYALSCKINEYRFLKKWERNDSNGIIELPSTEEDNLILNAYRVIRNLGFLVEWKNIGVENQIMIDKIQYYLLLKGFIE